MTREPLAAAELDELVAGLNKLSRNLWWSWDQEAQDLFQELSPRGWQNLYHNAVAVLREVSDYELRVRLQDADFAQRARAVLHDFEAYLADQKHLVPSARAGIAQKSRRVFFRRVRFSRIAADFRGRPWEFLRATTRNPRATSAWALSASVCFIAKVIFSRRLTRTTGRRNFTIWLTRQNVPLEPVLDAEGKRAGVQRGNRDEQRFFPGWRVNVGRVPVYLLDTNRPENEQHFRDLTARVYGGDSTTRIMQEILLGIGGVRLLRALGVQAVRCST